MEHDELHYRSGVWGALSPTDPGLETMQRQPDPPAQQSAAPAGAPSKSKSPQQRAASVKRLCKQAQAGQFLLKFSKWQSKMQKKLRTDTSAHNTLVALQLWNSYVYYDDARAAVV
eukprot:4306-Heterococcus_DN1.PRE.4